MKPLALVIENDSGTRKLLDVLLTRAGFEIDLVPTGSDALLLLANVPYDVLFIDLLLPGTNGMQILEWIAREQPQALARSIVLSAAPERQLHVVRERWPQVRVIRKPFELGEIVEGARAIAARREERVESYAEVFCRRSVRAGARAGVIVRNQGSRVEVLHSFGYQRGEVESYFPLQLEAQVPLCAAIRNAAPVWLASLTMAGTEYPPLLPVFEKNESRALAAVPLQRAGRVLGAVGWSFREPRLFAEAEQQPFLSIAATVAEGLPDQSGQSMALAGA
ncbi:MAG TPA: response regulator [Thermoanaerobaculia bacterium]|nr:response regulator [Thermoanaerobaculia bacterium]